MTFTAPLHPEEHVASPEIPEWHRKCIAALEGAGVHFHEGLYGTQDYVVGIRPQLKGLKFRLCGTDRCFVLKVKNVRKEEP